MRKIILAMMFAVVSLSSLACDVHAKNEEQSIGEQVQEEKFNIKELMKAMEEA